MKQFIITAIFLVSAFAFAQNTGSISGNLLDIESNNEPLMFAKVSIKENGAFNFQNLEDGTYTLVCSFTGYENKETETKVTSGKSTPIKLALTASTISIDDLMMAMASADKKTSSTSIN